MLKLRNNEREIILTLRHVAKQIQHSKPNETKVKARKTMENKEMETKRIKVSRQLKLLSKGKTQLNEFQKRK